MQQVSPDALISLSDVLTADLKQRAYQARVKDAEILMRNAYVQKLNKVPGPAVTLVNTVDNSTPDRKSVV